MNNPTELINRYFHLASLPDTDDYFAQFAATAKVEDEGRTYQGLEMIRGWRRTVPTVSYTIGDVENHDRQHTAYTEIGGDFPGSPVTLAFRFTFTDDGHIQTLGIRA